MQVGLHTSTLTHTSGLAPGTVKSQGVDRTAPAKPKDNLSPSEYPASPLLTTRPQRYSVQLNDQLTALQLADNYLSNLEQKLLDYRHVSMSDSKRRRGENGMQQQVAALQSLLSNRVKLTGRAVDCQLMPVLHGEAQVSFRAPGLASVLNEERPPESLLFSIHDGRKTQLSAVSVNEDTNEHQYATKVNNALRRLGVKVQKGDEGTVLMVKESQWLQLAHSFSVQGEGKTFPAKDKTRINLVAEPATADRLVEALSTGNWSTAQDTLNQLGEQRERLAAQQEKARQLIDSMSHFPETQSAVQSSSVLSASLNRASHFYDELAQAVNGQANLSKLTVRSLLG